jgi:DNA-binding response OmpR family regulator
MNRSIVIVEDDANLRFVFRVILESEGYQVNLLEDGDNLKSLPSPDLYILDNQLAGKTTGLQICRQLKSDESKKETPVIIISGNRDIKREAIAAGAQLFIEKPIEFDQLQASVRELLQK